MSKKKTQKVLIPKGTIDPNEDALIEIPINYKKAQIVVATKSNRSVNIAARGSRSTRSIAERDVEDYNYVIYDQKPTNRCSPVCYSKSIGQNRPSIQFQPARLLNTVQATSVPAISESDLNSLSLSDLSAQEKAEIKLVQEKLEAFQKARRQFLIESNNITVNSKGVQAKPSQS